MPQVTVYIRKEDLDKWRALDNKTETIHRLLNSQLTKNIIYDVHGRELKNTTSPDLFLDMSKGTSVTTSIALPTPVSKKENGTCKVHGTPLDSRGKCLQKGCKYA